MRTVEHSPHGLKCPRTLFSTSSASADVVLRVGHISLVPITPQSASEASTLEAVTETRHVRSRSLFCDLACSRYRAAPSVLNL
jgi:hypothetical protein